MADNERLQRKRRRLRRKLDDLESYLANARSNGEGLVYRMVSRGDLDPRPRHGRRNSGRLEAARPRMACPPDTEHEWLTAREAAALFGVSQVAINKRCRRDRLPCVEHGGRRWLLRDLLDSITLELDQRARHAEAAGVVPHGYALHDASAEQRLPAFSLAETMGSTAGPRAARLDKCSHHLCDRTSQAHPRLAPGTYSCSPSPTWRADSLIGRQQQERGGL